MKSVNRTIFITCGILLLGVAQLSNAQNSSRIRYTINDNWRFLPDNLNKDDSAHKWQKINLPHTWNAQDAFDDEAGYRRAVSWYRRDLQLKPSLKNKRIFLYFEGANQTADVFVNDRFIGRHIGGYTAFIFDVTDFARFDKPNLVAVKVDNTLDPEKPPINGDFTMYGGIYRDVWLVATDEIHLKLTDLASPGVRIETPQVSETTATVKISGAVVNSSGKAARVEVINTLFDAENKQVNTINSIVTVNPKSEAKFEQVAPSIKNPKLWSPENPYLYRVKTVIKDNGKILDEISQPLGFRWFKFDAENGFFLNGKALKLRGTNRHQDYAGLGNAVPDRLQVRDLEIIKENGFNFLRLAHYSQDPSVLEAADRLGILIWEEVPIVNQIHVSPVFNENAKQMLREMIAQHRNHPSIVIWGYMNEVFLPVPKTEETVKATVALAQELEKICRTEDSTRATAIAFDYGARELYHSSGLDKVTEIVGWNLYHGWYYETFADFGKFLDEEHRRFPTRPVIISEYGANGDRRLHSLEPKRFDSTIEWQRMFHEAYLPQINERKFLSGSAVWNQFDFGSEPRGETIPHINQKGLFTYNRQPKDISFFYRANFTKKPVLHVAAQDWLARSGNSNQMIDVYTNLPIVELFQNGVSLGKKEVNDYKKATWTVNLKAGKNKFVARGAVNRGLLTDSAEIFFQNTADFKEAAVNVGSNAQFTGEDKTIWQADQPFQTGSWGFIGPDSKAIGTGQNVLNTLEDPLFQTMLEGLAAYRFDAPDGDYEVELRFVEPKFKEPGQRVFDVAINGQTLVENLDLVKESGFMQALTRKFRINVKDKKGIVISFTARSEKTILSGVCVRRL